jgi:recombination protein RecR
MEFASKLLENAVYEISQLPGIGKKTALRLALHLLRQPTIQTNNLSTALLKLRGEIQYCKKCHNISDSDLCEICSSSRRDHSIVCVVEDIRDVMAIENTSQFNGIYHVLGGIISPMDGIGPQNLTIDSLIKKARDGEINEIIFALSSSMEGDTTNFYIYRQIQDLDISTSTIARGISIGDELQYADEITLGRSIINRIPYEKTLKK